MPAPVRADRRTIAIRHVAFEDLGLWDAPLRAEGSSLRYLQAGVDDLRSCREERPDLLVVLGGPIGVYESDAYPFLAQELELIRERLASGLALLGICLGAQLIAAAAGARVYPSGVKEIGFAPIELTGAGERSCLRKLAGCGYRVLHWHGDTFDLPPGAALLASTAAVRNQAFALGPRVLALQFHAEVDPRRLEPWLIGHACELAGAKLRPEDLRAGAAALPAADVAASSVALLEDWLAQALAPAGVRVP